MLPEDPLSLPVNWELDVYQLTSRSFAGPSNVGPSERVHSGTGPPWQGNQGDGCTDGSGIPLGALAASGQKAKVHLAEATLTKVRAPITRVSRSASIVSS